jgi:hypothetical protein
MKLQYTELETDSVTRADRMVIEVGRHPNSDRLTRISPDDLRSMSEGWMPGQWGKGVEIRGQVPVWVTAAMAVKYAEEALWVSVYDRRLGSPVEVSHRYVEDLPRLREKPLAEPGKDLVHLEEYKIPHKGAISSLPQSTSMLHIQFPVLAKPYPIAIAPDETDGVIIRSGAGLWLQVYAALQLSRSTNWVAIYDHAKGYAVCVASREPRDKPGRKVVGACVLCDQ